MGLEGHGEDSGCCEVKRSHRRIESKEQHGRLMFVKDCSGFYAQRIDGEEKREQQQIYQ